MSESIIADHLEKAATAIRKSDIEENIKKRGKGIVEMIKEHPVESVAAGVGAGILIGAVLTKKHYNK